jgi:hypothetical protein
MTWNWEEANKIAEEFWKAQNREQSIEATRRWERLRVSEKYFEFFLREVMLIEEEKIQEAVRKIKLVSFK